MEAEGCIEGGLGGVVDINTMSCWTILGGGILGCQGAAFKSQAGNSQTSEDRV